MARKATRGAGHPWALADEAGRAVGMLCRSGIDGCAALADLLARGGGQRPVIDGTRWRAPDGPLCPLRTGLALTDRMTSLHADAFRLHIESVQAPTLMLPFLCTLSQHMDRPLGIEAAGTPLLVNACGVAVPTPLPPGPVDLMIAASDETLPEGPALTRATPGAHAWDTLTRLAQLTYAPATDASRAGAGAGLTDND